ncbi:hypothetical protein B0H65DRAFT_205438 [Neurospora tetraspora]|uniref:Uncharacterized protein n=1 Tax=Neurospora tetraspora TaxID=94610 RepID=A0AAE0MSM8_9PEZI|nr:hypothetical protein B0H65DRAFT_205438 [Neurospora tetraspora]
MIEPEQLPLPNSARSLSAMSSHCFVAFVYFDSLITSATEWEKRRIMTLIVQPCFFFPLCFLFNSTLLTPSLLLCRFHSCWVLGDGGVLGPRLWTLKLPSRRAPLLRITSEIGGPLSSSRSPPWPHRFMLEVRKAPLPAILEPLLEPFSPPISIALNLDHRTISECKIIAVLARIAHEHYQGGICLVHPSSSAPCRFLYVVYTTTDYHGIVSPTSSHPSRPSSHSSHPSQFPCRPCETETVLRREYRRRDPRLGHFHRGTSQWAVQVSRTSSTPIQFYSVPVPQHSQGYPVPRKGRRRHRPSITVPKHHIPTGIGHWGQAELETDATRQRTSEQERPTFGVHLHYIIGRLCFELDIAPCLALD